MATVNIKDIAKKLGISVSTVSRALRDSNEISKETKKRVLALANKLNYIPNANASGLRSKVSKTIAVVVPEISEVFFSMVINGIDSVAQKKGYHVLVYISHDKYEKEKAIVKEFQNGRVDGMLISISAETHNDAHLVAMQKSGRPVVLFDRVMKSMQAAKVTTDDFESTYNATLHLIDNGCKRIAFLPFTSGIHLIEERLNGYKMALKKRRIPFRISLVYTKITNEEIEDHQLVTEMLRKQKPDGVIATAAKLSRFTYLACRDLKISIPGQLKVVSFSNVLSAEIFDPSLTTITQPAFEMGVEAATILFKALENEEEDLTDYHLVIPSAMHLRNSSRQI